MNEVVILGVIVDSNGISYFDLMKKAGVSRQTAISEINALANQDKLEIDSNRPGIFIPYRGIVEEFPFSKADSEPRKRKDQTQSKSVSSIVGRKVLNACKKLCFSLLNTRIESAGPREDGKVACPVCGFVLQEDNGRGLKRLWCSSSHRDYAKKILTACSKAGYERATEALEKIKGRAR